MVRVEVPDVLTVVGLNPQPAPVGSPAQVKVTVPLKPLVGVTVTVNGPADPPLVTVALVGVALTPKPAALPDGEILAAKASAAPPP